METETKRNNSTITAVIAAVAAAVLLVIGWLLPMVKLFGEPVSIFRVADMVGGSNGAAAKAGYVTIVVICAISILWAAIPKKWAAIVGIVYSLIPMGLTIYQLYSWTSNDTELAFGSILAVVMSVAVLILSIVKLVVLINAKKPRLPETDRENLFE